MTQSPSSSPSSSPSAGPDTARRPRRHAAGLFDIRNIIGALLAIYGVILLLMAFFGGAGRAVHDSGANLWTGIGLLVVGAFFLVWARVRPIVVDEVELSRQMNEGDDGSTMRS